MRGKRLVGAVALALALAAGIGGPAQAAAAPAGPAVEDPWELELVKVTETVGFQSRDITASCPAGKKAIDGGALSTYYPKSSEKTPDGTGWVARGASGSVSPGGNERPVTFTVYAVCACADKVA